MLRTDLDTTELAFAERYLTNGRNIEESAEFLGLPLTLARMMLTRPNVAQFIRERSTNNIMSAEEALARLSDIARGSIEDITTVHKDVRADRNGKPVEFYYSSFDLKKALDNRKMHLIRRWYVDANSNLRVEMHDPIKALDRIIEIHLKHNLKGKEDEVSKERYAEFDASLEKIYKQLEMNDENIIEGDVSDASEIESEQ